MAWRSTVCSPTPLCAAGWRRASGISTRQSLSHVIYGSVSSLAAIPRLKNKEKPTASSSTAYSSSILSCAPRTVVKRTLQASAHVFCRVQWLWLLVAVALAPRCTRSVRPRDAKKTESDGSRSIPRPTVHGAMRQRCCESSTVIVQREWAPERRGSTRAFNTWDGVNRSSDTRHGWPAIDHRRARAARPHHQRPLVL